MANREKLISHYKKLKDKHETLDKQIHEAYNKHTDDLLLQEMKLSKLHLKEEMSRVEQQLGMEDGKSIPIRY